MGNKYSFFIVLAICFFYNNIKAQKLDTTLAHQNIVKAERFADSIRYDSAVVYYNLAAEAFEQAGAWGRFVYCKNNVGYCWRRMGQYGRALEVLEAALDFGTKYLGEWHLEVARSHYLLGVVMSITEEYNESIRHVRQAIDIRKKLAQEDSLEMASYYVCIGICFSKKGDYGEALRHHELALHIKLKILGEEHMDVACSYFNIGNTYYEKKQYEEALRYYQLGLNIIPAAVLQNGGLRMASILMNVGVTYWYQSDAEKALDYYEKAKEIIIGSLGAEHPMIATYYTNVGLVFGQKGDYGAALNAFEKALAINQKVFGDKHRKVAGNYRSIGEIYFQQDDYEIALAQYQQAIMAYIPDYNNASFLGNPDLDLDILDELGLVESLQSKALALSRMGKDIKYLDLAIENYKLAFELLDKMRKSYLLEDARLDLSGESAGIYTAAIPVCLDAFAVTNARKYLEEAFQFFEKGKAVVLSEAIRESWAKQFGGIPNNLSQQERVLKEKMYSYQQEISEARENNNFAKLAVTQGRLSNVKEEWKAFIKELEKDYPEYHELKYKDNATTIRAVQKLLDEKSALIEYVEGDTAMWVFTITQDTAFCKAISLPKNFEQELKTFMAQIELNTISNSTLFTKILKDYTSAAYGYYKLLLAPVLTELDPNVNKLHIIADGVLSYLPFEILLTEEVDTQGVKERGVNYVFAQLPYLPKKYATTYNYSSTLALQMHAVAGEILDGAKVFALAPFAEEPKEGKMQNMYGRPRKGVRTLPGSWDEIQAIAKYFDGYYATKGNATERTFLNKLREEYYDIIHICAHGDASLDKAHESARIYLNSEVEDMVYDNILHAFEIYNLPLKAKLVVLSACETGRGKHKEGEGVMSLARAFSYAGCPGLVTTLWNVDDMASAVLMGFFYETLSEGETTDFALQQARLKYLEREFELERTDRLSAHPYYWAGYINLGKNIQVGKIQLTSGSTHK